MSKEIAMDLRVARKHSGLHQTDCAHLLDISGSKMSRIESGELTISLRELCILSMTYNRPLQSLCQAMFNVVRKELPERIETLPADDKGWIPQFNRNNTLDKLSARLRTLDQLEHAGS